MQVLWGFNEAEVDGSFVSCAQAVTGHRQDSSCLPDATTVHCGKGSTRKMLRGKSHILAFKSVKVHVSPMAWYLGEMVVGWCKTSISASNSQYACGFNLGDTMTIPFLIEERLIWRREKWQGNKEGIVMIRGSWTNYSYEQVVLIHQSKRFTKRSQAHL